jgi:DNA excision repair protein ERCC-3
LQVLNAGDEAAGVEQLDEDVDDITQWKTRRTMGTLGKYSGADGMVYMEFG